MARLVVFGVSGATGRPLVAQALAAGHEVTAFDVAGFLLAHLSGPIAARTPSIAAS
ncbi:MAG TPA: hypothetical protein VLU41_14240 [Ideonella sp.]|nr:hypothetical protein [Ideonella sp.]